MCLETSVRVGGVLLFAFISTITALAQPIHLRVDATEAPRRLCHVGLTIHAAPAPLELFYPKWITGEHARTCPITDVAGLRISSGGRTLEWKRDSVEMFAFHIDVPQGASSVDVKLDFLSNSDAAG